MYEIGLRPYWRLKMDKQVVWENGIQTDERLGDGLKPDDEFAEYAAAIGRLDVDIGVDQVNICTFDVYGREAALVTRELFERGREVEIEMGYRDTDEPPQRVFKGTVMRATPSAAYPAIISVEADSDAYKAREVMLQVTEADDAQTTFINEFQEAELLLPTLTDAIEEGVGQVADVGGVVTGYLLNQFQQWLADAGLHFLDVMQNNEIHVFYPTSVNDVFMFNDKKRGNRIWELAMEGDNENPDIAAVLSSWMPTVDYVDAPHQITAAWYDVTSPDDKGDLVYFAVPETAPELEDGQSLRVWHAGILGHFVSADAAKKTLASLMETQNWLSATGTFELLAGLPILPLDTIKAVNGYPGLEGMGFYDEDYRVTRVKHVFDNRGWRVSGTVRGGADVRGYRS